MKKLFVLFIFALFLLLPSTALATNGCCSNDHLGIDCSKGPQKNGHIVCKDGWKGSSCLYANMSECSGYSAPVVAQTTKPITTAKPATTKPQVKPTSTPTIAPTNTPIETPTSSPVATVTSTTAPQLKGDTKSTVGGGVITLGVMVFGIWKGIMWLSKKTAPKDVA